MPALDPGASPPCPPLIDGPPADWAAACRVVTQERQADRIGVTVDDPLNTAALDTVSFWSGLPVEASFAERADLTQLLRSTTTAVADEAEVSPETTSEDSPAEEGATDAPVIQRVTELIEDAIRHRASDIHLEPLEKRFRVRYRIDGVLRDADSPAKSWQLPMISRLKIMANLSIAEKRLPQDGRIQIGSGDRPLDLRVSSIPTVHGESIVMRVLDRANLSLGPAELGMLPDDQALFAREVGAADGIVLVTGPTGSGKTTTLYACLHQLNHPDRKIITVEDPVEYQLPGINQVAVNPLTGLTFATALRAMLRQAPTVVMVGEIRDRETAEIAINASLTGHLVFSTLHTNDAPAAVMRLLEVGVKPFLIAASLRAVVAQRLVRKICPHCRREYRPTSTEAGALGLPAEDCDKIVISRGAGCAACEGTGYLGRIGLFEIFLVHDDIRAMIYGKITAARLREQARRDGMRTMREDGIRKVLAGLTTIEEVVAATMRDSA